MKLMNIKEMTGTITLRTGLHIGAGDAELKIGGTDNPVVKHPHTQEPYIPGSSLKGKIRALLEMRSGLMQYTGGAPFGLSHYRKATGSDKEEGEKILKLFGASGDTADETNEIGVSRASFADCPLDEDWKENALFNHLPLTEVKSENSINRISGTAQNPRFTERVPSSTKFRFSISLKEMDRDTGLQEYLMTGLRLLELDALGGSGSRGYGQVRFDFDDEILNDAYRNITPF